MTESLKLSVVLATYNRAETLRETLRHLADQDLDPKLFEVIVIDDGSPDHTRDLVAGLGPIVPFQMTYFHHANHGPGYTQNRGIREARGPIVLLMADDIMMARHTLRTHLEVHERNPEETVAVLGKVVQSPLLTQSVFLRKWESFRFADFEGLVEVPYYRFWACNISVKRDFMLRQGLFREPMGRAGPAAHEDPELGCRLHRAGLRILFAPQALGYHYHVVTLATACQRAYQQGLNFDEFRAIADAPEIVVAYRDLRWRTFGDHLRTWFGPSRQQLPPRERNPIISIARHLTRRAVFNRATIRWWWIPLLDRAERDERVAALMRPAFYRGLVSYHFFKGCRDGNRRFGIPQVERA